MSTAPGVVFDAAWFARHQRVLLRLLACPIVGRWLRWVLCIRACDLGYRRRIVAIGPHYYTVAHADGTVTTDVRTHAKYGKRLYYAGLPVWRLAHAWDQWIANPFAPAWNLGFDTLTVYTDPDTGAGVYAGPGWDLPGSVTQNGFSNARNSADFNNATSALNYEGAAQIETRESNGIWGIKRGMWGFYLGIPIGSVESAVFSLYHINDSGANTLNIDPEPRYGVYDFTPADPTRVNGTTDWQACGTTLLSDDILIGSDVSPELHNQYVSHTLNATGRAKVGLLDYFICCMREIDHDVADVAPTWTTAFQYSRLVCYYADQTGSSTDPKLEITYTPASPLPPRNRLRPRIFAPGRAK